MWLALGVFLGAPALAGEPGSASASGRASATVLPAPLQTQERHPLFLGQVITGPAGGWVEARPNAGVDFGGAAWPLAGRSVFRPARYRIVGQPGAGYRVDAGPIQTKQWAAPSGREPVVETLFFWSENAAREGAQGILDRQGEDTLLVGARLDLKGPGLLGVWVGSIELTVGYD
ncbi:hypothetical protein SAMN05421742_1138 [Roseospirillum parvum]|uniref:DUF4402 domain-containing protein n=1 Tax=Roseospirillum parvum TaxID=83401 RepID=A0A1G8FA27_9PROT|nr:hypothetical protein SAMN05421742_1138 [Roseospirillum parvum]